MDEWHQRLKKLQEEGDCHSTLQGSMSLFVLAYACSMPSKRAEVGTIHVFPTQPSEADVALTPNFIVMAWTVRSCASHNTKSQSTLLIGMELMRNCRMSSWACSKTRMRDGLGPTFFVDSNGNGYTPGGFSTWVRRTIARLFGDKSPSVSLLRHSYCTSLDYNTLTGAQRDVRKPGTVRKPKTNTAI